MPRAIEKPEQAASCLRAESFCRHGDHELRMFTFPPDPRQIEAVNAGVAEFALVIEEPVIVLCARFGDAVPWTSAPFVGDEARRDSRSMPPALFSPHETRALLHVSLVDALTAQIHAERNLTLWLDFSRALNEAIRERERTLFHPVEHNRALARLRRKYSSDAVLAASSKVRCFGSL